MPDKHAFSVQVFPESFLNAARRGRSDLPKRDIPFQVKIADFMKGLNDRVAPHGKSRIASGSGQFPGCLCQAGTTR